MDKLGSKENARNNQGLKGARVSDGEGGKYMTRCEMGFTTPDKLLSFASGVLTCRVEESEKESSET